jgi:uncharacterized membrane protein YkvI
MQLNQEATVHIATAPNPQREPFRIPAWLGLCLFLAIAAFFLWEEHRAHILGALPYALLLLCPIIHLFMHRGHGGRGAAHSGHEDHANYHSTKGAAS